MRTVKVFGGVVDAGFRVLRFGFGILRLDLARRAAELRVRVLLIREGATRSQLLQCRTNKVHRVSSKPPSINGFLLILQNILGNYLLHNSAKMSPREFEST